MRLPFPFFTRTHERTDTTRRNNRYLYIYTVKYILSAHGRKCKLKEGGGQIIRSFYKCDIVSAHSNAFQTRGMQSEYTM